MEGPAVVHSLVAVRNWARRNKRVSFLALIGGVPGGGGIYDPGRLVLVVSVVREHADPQLRLDNSRPISAVEALPSGSVRLPIHLIAELLVLTAVSSSPPEERESPPRCIRPVSTPAAAADCRLVEYSGGRYDGFREWVYLSLGAAIIGRYLLMSER